MPTNVLAIKKIDHTLATTTAQALFLSLDMYQCILHYVFSKEILKIIYRGTTRRYLPFYINSDEHQSKKILSLEANCPVCGL